jgi:hypothetical protein
VRSQSAACSDCRTLLGGYVLGALEPAEADSVRDHLSVCAECSVEHAQLAGIPGMLDVAGSAETAVEQPPAALEEAVLDRFARESRPGGEQPRDESRGRRRLDTLRRRFAHPLPAAALGALAAAAVTVAVTVLPGGSSNQPGGWGATYQARLSGLPAAPSADASAKLTTSSSGTYVRLKVSGLHGSPGTVYELWCLRDDGEKVSAGTFRTDGGGHADVHLTTAAVPGEYHRLSVERRVLGPAAEPGQRVMAGEIVYPQHG